MDQESLNDTGPSWRCFKPTETEDVPDLPGLYAWYLNFVNPQQFCDPKKFLTKYAQYVQNLNATSEAGQRNPHGGNVLAELKGPGQFGDHYHASLSLSHKLIEVDSESSRSEPEGEIAAAAQNILQQLFNDAFTIFAAPLYVGKTDNLKRRVVEHLAAIDEAADQWERHGHEQFVEHDHAKNFGERIVSLNLRRDRLLFFCVPIEYQQLGISKAEATYWIEEAEYYFNNISRPMLGRK